MNNNKGFTLIELIVVIAVLSVLSLMIIPSVINTIESANESVDIAHVRQLNFATQVYRHTENIPDENLLVNFSSDDLRQEYLVDNGYLPKRIEARSSQYDIEWNSQLKLWIYTKFEVSTVQQAQYFFPTLTNMNIFNKGADSGNNVSDWNLTNTGLVGSQGSVFLDNSNSSYTIETTGRLNNTSANGGFGFTWNHQ